ncbi:MAG: hypothetical protein KBC08_02740 [Caldisericia bacterium]|nr:hypothetical protein [Caldisericia bacterium]
MNREIASLAKKTLLFFALFLVVMGLAIFLPAWSFAYWEGWVYISIYFVLVLLVTLYLLKNDPELLKRRLHRGPFSEKDYIEYGINPVNSRVYAVLPSNLSLKYTGLYSTIPKNLLSAIAF